MKQPENPFMRVHRKAKKRRETHHERAAAQVMASSRRDPVRLPPALAHERRRGDWWDRMKGNQYDANVKHVDTTVAGCSHRRVLRPVERDVMAPPPDTTTDMDDAEWRSFVADTLRELYELRRQALDMVS